MHLLRLAWLQVYAVESAEGADGRSWDIRKLQIELHHLVAADLTGICYRDGRVQRITGMNWRVRQSKIAVTECRITEAASKRPERLAFEVPVGPTLHRVVLEMGQLVDVFIEGDRETSGGIVLAAQGLSNGGSAFLAGIPSFHNGIGVCLLPVDAQCAAVHEYDNERLASRGHSLNQVLFRFWQIKAGAVSTRKAGLIDRHFLAFEAAGDADHRDDNVGIFRRGNGRGIRRIVNRSPQELRCKLAI